MKKHWHILKPDAESVHKIRKILHCTPMTATILANRQIDSQDDVLHFINPSLKNLRPPFSLKDMDAAVRRIFTAITRQEKILLFGDYDVDGITAVTILLEFLQQTGANAAFYIPHRTQEGYGLKTHHITDYAIPKGFHLIVTVDCGSSSHEAVETAQRAGIDVIITDHHELADPAPPALAVVNPKRSDCTSDLENLAGVGVAFYLLVCLRKHLREAQFWQDRPEPNLKSICDLVALGTVADSVPITEENRIITRAGIEVIKSGSNRPGIEALLTICNIDRQVITSEDIAFKLVPRLNAAGRIGHANSAVELLTTDSLATARPIAQSLEELNRQRKEVQKKITDQVQAYLSQHPETLRKRSLVLAHQDWHEGVLGIVASRITEQYFRPVVLISTQNGVGKGSARSIPGCHLYEALCECADELEAFGGHSMAAGLRIDAATIGQFRQRFESIIREKTQSTDLNPKLAIDYDLQFHDISDKLLHELESLQPFGEKNPDPLFQTENVKVCYSKILGGSHRRMVLRQEHAKAGKAVNAIQFNIDTRLPMADKFTRIAFRMRWNYWNGKKTPQIFIEDTQTTP